MPQLPAQPKSAGLSTTLSLMLLAASLSGCGSDEPPAASAPIANEPPAAAAPPAPTTLAGTVAVGAPMNNGRLRILDATGVVVADNVAVDADGRYEGVVLTGTAPWRLQACGTVAGNYQCIYSVAQAAGTANVTPLTTAAVLLAAGQSPDTLMTGASSGLGAAAMETAQATLRTGLSGVLADAGLGSDLNFVSGVLNAGSRSGYDRVLDAIGVSVGEDQGAFVQITPRLGTGNLYLQAGAASSGTLTVDPRARNLSLAGVETLFRDMTRAVASSAACANTSTGMQALLASDARLAMGEAPAVGPAQAAQALCQLFAEGFEPGSPPMWGSQFLSPTLGRCDLSGERPVCKVSFVLKTVDGDVMQVGDGMTVAQDNGTWKFRGESQGISLHAGATVQRDRRVDAAGAADVYTRAFQFEVPALDGLNCASVSQRNADGQTVHLAFYKRHPGAQDQQRLSAWRANAFSTDLASSAATGFTRSADDSWVHLPDGAAGDEVIRNFYRGGRTVSISLFSDALCSSPYTPAGDSASVFEVDVMGVPPVASAMAGMAWPDVTASTVTALAALAMDSGASASLGLAWTFRRGPMGIGEVTVCADRPTCGEGGSGRLAQSRPRPGQSGADLSLRNQGPSFGANSAKMMALYGRNGEGLSVQSNYLVCPAVAAGSNCQ